MKKAIQELKEKVAWYKQQLEELHMVETSEDWYKLRRFEIESQIAMLEDALDELVHQRKVNKDVERGLIVVGFSAIVLGLILLLLYL